MNMIRMDRITYTPHYPHKLSYSTPTHQALKQTKITVNFHELGSSNLIGIPKHHGQFFLTNDKQYF